MDAVDDSLLEFLRSGSLATIRLGMSVDELLAALGKPDDVGHQCAEDSAYDHRSGCLDRKGRTTSRFPCSTNA